MKVKSFPISVVILLCSFIISSCAPTYLSTQTDNACQNPKLIALEKKDSLTTEEMQLYIGLKQICEERRNAAALEQQLNKVAEAQNYFMYLSLTGLLAGIIVLMTNSSK